MLKYPIRRGRLEFVTLVTSLCSLPVSEVYCPFHSNPSAPLISENPIFVAVIFSIFCVTLNFEETIVAGTIKISYTII